MKVYDGTDNVIFRSGPVAPTAFDAASIQVPPTDNDTVKSVGTVADNAENEPEDATALAIIIGLTPPKGN